MINLNELTRDVKNTFLKSQLSHDWEHTERVIKLCRHIGKTEKADMDILEAAAILHDIGRDVQDKAKGEICHAEVGAVMAKEVLKKYNLPPEIVEKICHCIETHRYRNSKVPQSTEAKVLFDSDKLDAIGAIGIGRAFLFAGEIGAKVHNKGVDISETESYTQEDTAYREFMVKLRKVKDKMLTQEGKKLAEGRHKFMLEFFLRLDQEVDGLI